MNQIDELKKIYGKNECPRELLSNLFRSNHDIYEIQELIYSKIVDDTLLKAHLPSDKYLKLFLKTIIGFIEEINEEIHPNLLEFYIKLINSNDNREKYFITYFFDNSKPIIIEQFESIISNGTTGLHIWPACVHLIEYLKKDPQIIKEKTVLELGSGIGLLGLICKELYKCSKYIFTDTHPMVLQQIQKNLELNGSNNCHIYELNWQEPHNCKLREEDLSKIDLILASDIIFDPQMVPFIIQTLKYLLTKSQNNHKSAIISSTIRNRDTYSLFIDLLNKGKFQVETLKKCDHIDKKATFVVEILKINL